MEPIFHFRLPSGCFEDPFLFVRLLRERRALQFDLGDISSLSASELYKISDVFVTHTHIDHFIGFDILLRAILRRETPLNIYGPPNITACVAGKLRGYAWNLIRDYPLIINVFAYNGRTLSHSVFRAKNRLRREAGSVTDCDGTLLNDNLFRVRAVKLSHGTPCIAYSLEEECHINIDKDRLMRKGLDVGPWLTTFKKMLRENSPSGGTLQISGKTYRIDQLAEIATLTKGQKISFATDIAVTKGNIARLIDLVKDSDVFFCEAYYLEKERALAKERFHLTAKICGSIAKRAGAKKLVVIHVSPKYMDNPDAVIAEAMEEFREKAGSNSDVRKAVLPPATSAF